MSRTADRPGLLRLQAQESAPRVNTMRAVVQAVVEGRSPLASLEEACRLLSECDVLEEVRQIRDVAEAARLYARAVNRGLDAQNNAAEIKIRAERRAGELLTEMAANGERAKSSSRESHVATLKDLGIEKIQSHRWQQIAGVPALKFEAHIEQAKTSHRELSSAGVYNLAVRTRKDAGGWATPVPRAVSVYENDQEALSSLLFINLADPGHIVDVTHNTGVMWRGVPFRPWRADIDRRLLDSGDIDDVADFRDMPAAWDGNYQAIVFDPPHITDTTDRVDVSEFNSRFGLGADGPKGASIVDFYMPFLEGARRVLTDDGIILAKISNMVHGQAYQDQARSFKNLAEATGFRHCFDAIVVNEQRGNMNDPKWVRVYHPRTIHTYWLVLRKGQYCYPRQRVNGSDRRHKEDS